LTSAHASGIVIVKEKKIKPSKVDENAPVEQTFKSRCFNRKMKEKGKPSKGNVLMEQMKEKDKPSDGILFQRKEEGTLQWRRKPSR